MQMMGGEVILGVRVLAGVRLILKQIMSYPLRKSLARMESWWRSLGTCLSITAAPCAHLRLTSHNAAVSGHSVDLAISIRALGICPVLKNSLKVRVVLK